MGGAENLVHAGAKLQEAGSKRLSHGCAEVCKHVRMCTKVCAGMCAQVCECVCNWERCVRKSAAVDAVSARVGGRGVGGSVRKSVLCAEVDGRRCALFLLFCSLGSTMLFLRSLSVHGRRRAKQSGSAGDDFGLVAV